MSNNMLWSYENDSTLTLHFLAFTKTTDTFNKNKWCHKILEGLSSVCGKLEPASSKSNKILKINVLQKFTVHALCQGLQFMKILKVIRGFFLKCIWNKIFSGNFISPESAAKDKKIAACCFLTSCFNPKNLLRLEGVQTKEKHDKRFIKKSIRIDLVCIVILFAF